MFLSRSGWDKGKDGETPAHRALSWMDCPRGEARRAIGEAAGAGVADGMQRRKKMNVIEALENEQMRVDIPDFKPGDTIRVHARIKEGEKERVQVFQGFVLRKHKGKTGGTFTVRKVSYGIGVERIFPLHSPTIDKIEIVTRGRVRRGRIYYMRKLRGKAARIREKRF
jgi:large subunit ribosomal protein L19